jgi:hypothetical protein
LQVLASLSSRSGNAPAFIPYRDSKLTQLLWEGLRGTGRALMLACLGPVAGHAEESLSTLHFASMALRIKSQPVILLDPQVSPPASLPRLLLQLHVGIDVSMYIALGLGSLAILDHNCATSIPSFPDMQSTRFTRCTCILSASVWCIIWHAR